MSKKCRWIVNFTSEYAVDDWGAGDSRKIFDNEKDAKDFAETVKRKGKPFYWQPHIWQEVEVERKYKKWVVDKKS